MCGARGPVTVCFDPLFALDVETALCAELGLRRRRFPGLVEVWTRPQRQQPTRILEEHNRGSRSVACEVDVGGGLVAQEDARPVRPVGDELRA